MAARTTNIMLAGFGGQGILFAGKLLAYAGLMDGKEVSWLPSYGPEMRGGTANCSVVISDEPIGSPLVVTPDVLVAMNRPSYEKFIDTVRPGGTVIVDTTMVENSLDREDVNYFALPATQMAEDNGISGLANVIITGKLNKELDLVSVDALGNAVSKCVSARRQDMIGYNKQALEIGRSA